MEFDKLRLDLESRPRRSLERPKSAAVLVPVIGDGGPLRLLLTRRTNHLPTHKGHVAFPGGAIDPDDLDPTATALREAEEEIGLPRSAVEVLGWLDDFITVHNDTTVTPVVGLITKLPQLTPEPGEVARIFSIPIETLMQRRSWRVETVSRREMSWPMPYCDYDGETLWGLSAYIAIHLLEFLPEGAPIELPHHLIK